MVTDSTSQTDDTTAFLRAARSGNLEKVIEYLDTDLDINTANSNDLNALHLASKDGHVEIVTELLKRGAKVDAATKKGNTALHIASLAGQAEIVNILIQYGAQVNIQSQNGFTPLYMAAQENHDHVVKILLNNGANQSLATEDGFTPLAVAMQQGHDKVVSVLLENDSKGKVRLPALHIAAKKDDCKAADLLLQNDHKPDVTSKSGFTPLHIAAHYGNEEIARLLIKRGADVNYQAKFNISPLHVAAKWGKNNMVKVLLENGAVIDAKTKDGLTPLHCAARSGHEEVVSTLLENSAPISARSKNGLAPLHMASQGDHVDAARVLLYHRAPVDEVTIDYLTSLHVAAHCGHVRVAKLLLDRKADPNARALNGFTPLHIACKKNRIKVVELLLKHGASIESTTESGLTPLHVASFMGCMNIVIFLLQHEANPDVPTVRGETPLHLAARANQTDIIRILLRNGAKVDARAREQQTPLHIASRLGNVDIVMLLLQHGAAVDTTTKDMYTALHIAAKEGQDEVAAILIENKASIKATTKNGFTPLHIAAKYGNINVSKILLQKESKLDAQGKNNITPLHLACHYDHPNVAQLLLEKGASPHLASQNGHTPLHIAARKNQMDTASILLEHGAKANVESKAGFTPLHLSAQKGHYDMTNLLIEHGADPNHKAKNGLTALHLCAQEDFIRVASILVKNGANIENQTQTGYRPIHVAAHFGNLSMIRFLLKHNAEIDVRTNQKYTPLHQAAQQGHAHVVSALIEGSASHRARTNDGLTALNIAQKLGYISVMEVLKGLSYDGVTPDNKNWEEKYKVIAPESLQETSFMSDSDDEGGSDALISEQPYRYLTADLMKSLRDDSLPIDVTRDDPVHRQVSKEEKQQFVQSNNYCMGENFDSNDNMNFGRLHFRSFLVSFLVDARGGTMKGCRHSGIRIVVPPRRATMPIRVTCRLVKPNKVVNPPPLMEGEALGARIIEMGPVGASFLGPVLIDIPNFAAIRGKDREIIILRSENGENWKEHDNSLDNDDNLLNTPYDSQMSALHSGRITRIITSNFPQYFAIVTRIKQEVHVIGAEGGILISSVANHVQAVFPPGALTKKIIVGLQAHVIPAELTAKLLGNSVAVSPVVTIEPRRRKFHKPITLTIPVPQAANKGMINQYGGETPSLRLLCSIAGGTIEAQWEDVTGSTPLTFMNDRVSFTTTVSARFWLMDYRNVCEVPRMATELYKESLFVPFITNFVIYSKRFDLIEATLRILCMTDGKDGLHTLEKQEEFLELVKSRDVEALDGKDLYIEFSGNLVPVTKSGVQLKFTFKSFRQNRISFHVKVKDPTLDPVARMLFMREPKVAKGEPPQQPVCVLNIVLPETLSNTVIKKKLPDFEDSNKISQSMDLMKSKYVPDHKEKCDEPKSTSPSEKKFITDTLQKEQTDAATTYESLTQKAAYSLESVDASYPNKVSDQEDELLLEKQTYSEKRKFWEDITRKRDSYQRSESEVSRTSQLTFNESDSEYIPNVVSEEDTAAISGRSETMEDMNIPDISECSVAEKAHYFEEQIQKEMSTAKVPFKAQESLKEKDKSKIPSKSDQGGSDFKLDKMDLKLDLELDRNNVEQIDHLEGKVGTSKPHFSGKEEKETSVKESDERRKSDEKEIRKEKEEILATFEKQGTSQGLIEGQKEREESLNKKLQQEEMFAKEDITEVLKKEAGIVRSEKEFIHEFKTESKIPVKILSQEGFKDKIDFSKKKEEQPISRTEVESLGKEKIEKGSTSIPETSKVKKIEKDVKERQKSFEQDFPIAQELEEFTTLLETKSIKKQENEFKIKKEFESRIPVSMLKTEKEKSPKQKENKIEIPDFKPSKSFSKTDLKSAEDQKSLDKSLSNFETAIEPEKKKDFESRIPKRVHETDIKKEPDVKKEYLRMEAKTREEVTSTKRKSETQTFSKTFTGHPQDAIKLFEDMSALKTEPEAIVTSKIDHEASTTREKKETKSSEISKGDDKFLMEEEKEHVESKKISESILKKQSPDEMLEEKKSKIQEFDKTALQKTSISLTADKQVIDASASQATIQSKETQKSKLFEDKEKIVTEVEDVSKFKESNVDVGMKIETDLLNLKEDIVEVTADENFRKEESKSFDAKSIFKDVTPSHEQPVTELEARNIAETLVQSIENEIEKRSISSDSLKKELEDPEPLESEGSDNQLADDLTRKFESIMRKSICKDDLESGPSIQEGILEKDYTQDSASTSEDLTKDEDSYPQDKEGLSSSRFHVTISSSSISDQVDLEDMEANVAEGDLLKSKKSMEFDKSPATDQTKDPMKGQQGTIYSEISGARVLEILEPEQESQSRQDSMDISSLEIDDFRSSEFKDMKGLRDLEDIKDLEEDIKDLEDTKDPEDIKDENVSSLHESAAVDSLDKIYQEQDRDITMSPSTVSEETNIDFSLPSELPPIRSYTEGGMMSRKGDSFEIHSPPMISPRSKVKDLEIKPSNWMIGDEKIEISETLQPSQAFDKELEEYQSTIKQESLTMSQDDDEMGFEPEPRMESKDLLAKSTEKEIPKDLSIPVKSKFTVTKVSDQDLERELVEDKLEASCQELIDTLERERKAKTPVGDLLDEMSRDEKFQVSQFERKDFKEANLDFSDRTKSLKEELSKDLLKEQDSSKESTKIHHETKSESKTKGKEDFSKGRSFAEDHKRVTERGDKPAHDHSALKIKKEDLQNVNLSARYAITVLDQVVKKEIAEVKESLEAAKQDLIEELSENSETVFQIKDSPSEFQFKLQSESIPNELPFLYKTPSSEKSSDHDSTPASGSPIIKPRRKNTVKDQEDDSEASTFDKKDTSLKSEETSWDFREDKPTTDILIETDQPKTLDSIQIRRDASLEETHSSSPVPASRSSSEMDKDDSFSLQPPQPAPRRRQKPARSKKVISESEEAESSGESNYQSCDYEIGSGSRPSSSDFEAMQSALSGTLSEYETALMSMEHSRPTSQDYQTAASTMSSRESMKSLNSLSSGHLGSIDSTSELSETLVPSEPEVDDKDAIDVNLETALDDDPIGTEFGPKIVSSNVLIDVHSDVLLDVRSDSTSDITADTLESDLPCRMKRSSEMIFPQLSEESFPVEEQQSEGKMDLDQERMVEELEPKIGGKVESRMDEKLESMMYEESESWMDQESKSRMDQESESRMDQESQSRVDQEPELRMDRESKSTIDQESESRMDRELKSRMDQESESRMDQKSKSRMDQESESRMDQKSKSRMDQESESRMDQESESRMDQKQEPRLDQKQEPRIDKKQEPRMDQKQEPRLDQKQEPRIDKKQEPRMDQKQEPRMDQKQEPRMDQKQELRMDQEQEPSIDQEQKPMMDKKKEPRMDQKQEPRMDQEQEPRMDQKQEPKIDQEQEPKMDQKHEPRMDKKHEPRMDQKQEPRMDQEQEARMDQKQEPRMDQEQEPRMDQKQEPRMDQKQEPRMDKKQEPRMDQAPESKIDQELKSRIDESSEPRMDERIHEREDERIEDIKSTDSSTSTKESKLGVLESVDIMTARINEDGIQSVSTQVISREASSIIDDLEEQAMSFEPDSLDQRLSFTGPDDENESMQTSTRTWLQQASMSTSSASGLSVETVVEKDLQDRNSPDSDSFELVDKPDIIDDFVVIEEVGREAEEFDSEGKSIRISSMSYTSVKQYDRDVENLITENKDEKEVSTSQVSRNNELFEFESEESPPQASNDDQYSQSYSDEEQYEGGKKWIEMQFQSDARLYDIEYERGPLEDIKEEEITDFEAGSSRFGSMGSHKESIGSVGSMRGSYGSTPDYDTLIGKKYFTKPTDHDNVSLSSLQEFEHLESAVALENSKKFSSGSQDSGSNGSLPRRYASRSGHGDDVSLSSLKDFEGLEKACTEAHLIELRAREEEDLLDHESPENKFRLESLAKAKADISAAGSVNPSTSGSDDYEKRIKEIDEIIRIAQANVEKLERQDDTTEDISQIEAEKGVGEIIPEADVPADVQLPQETKVMETSTDSLELEDNAEKKYNMMCRSSDSLELKTTLDFPSLSSDSLNNVRDPRDVMVDVGDRYHGERRISSDSLEIPAHELQESEKQLRGSESNSDRPEESAIDLFSRQTSSKSSTEKTKSTSASGI